MRSQHKPGIFWTWQDPQIEERHLLAAAVDDMAAAGFGTLLVQPRGCRYPVDDGEFVAAVGAACELAHARGLDLWLHLDPRSMSRSLSTGSVAGAEYLIVAGVSDGHRSSPRRSRPLDVVAQLAEDGTFGIRLEYPKVRPYHVHSDGAFGFRPVRLERCLAFRVNASGVVMAGSVHDITGSSHLFTNELSGYVEVFGSWRAPHEEGWQVLALVAFASNYPEFASNEVRERIGGVIESYAALEERPDGLWWDEPGYCTGFDRAFRGDRGRIPWGQAIAALHRARTGRDPLDDVLYLLFETDDGLWGARREQFYRTVEAAVFGAQADLGERARAALGEGVRLGAHQTWHQNADDVLNGCADWWRGAAVLGAGFTDVGNAERVDDPLQMAEVTALGVIAVSLGRRSEHGEAYYNLWGVEYGDEGMVPGPGVLDWWVDLQATLGCNWLAHTYGPTGYFERPSVWGPGYPNHPTWDKMAGATARLAWALELAQGQLPQADVALVYPLGTMFRLGSDLANPLAQGAHRLVDSLTRAGFELDVVSPEELRKAPVDRYRAVLYLHPFGAAPEDVEDLGRRRGSGAAVLACGLPPVPGHGYASAESWLAQLGLTLPDAAWPQVIASRQAETIEIAGKRLHYRGVPDWGRPLWVGEDGKTLAVAGPRGACLGAPSGSAGHAGPAGADTVTDGPAQGGVLPAHGPGTAPAAYAGLLLEGLEDAANDLLSGLGIEPSWQLPQGAFATRTRLPSGSTLLRLCPARFGRPFQGILRIGDTEVEFGPSLGLLCLRLAEDGQVSEALASEGSSWSVPSRGSQ